MKRWLLAAALVAGAACDTQRDAAAPQRTVDPALRAALASALPGDRLVVIVNYDEAATTSDAMSAAIQNVGSGVIQFNNLDLVAAYATPAEITAISALPAVQGVYANKQLRYSAMLHESVATIGADAVRTQLGITGKGIGIAILDSGIDGLYNPDLVYPTKTVQNIKVLANLNDLFTFKGSLKKPAKAANLFVENLPNSETSVGHGTHVAGITAGLGAASGGYYTGVAPGANLIGIGTGDVLFIFWALAGFDYILDHRTTYNIKVVNNSWGTSGPFDPKDPINKASKKVSSKGITVVFAAGNDGPGENTLNPYSVAPWVIGVAAGCKSLPDPTNSAIHCADQTPQGRDPVLADFSSRGIPGDPLYHPDITAPGVHIVSTRASTGTVLNVLDANHDLNLTSTCAISVAIRAVLHVRVRHVDGDTPRGGGGGTHAGSGRREPDARSDRVGPHTDGSPTSGLCAVGGGSRIRGRIGRGERGAAVG